MEKLILLSNILFSTAEYFKAVVVAQAVELRHSVCVGQVQIPVALYIFILAFIGSDVTNQFTLGIFLINEVR